MINHSNDLFNNVCIPEFDKKEFDPRSSHNTEMTNHDEQVAND